MFKLHKPLAFILLVIFLANMGLWSFAKINLSHELMHADIVQLAPDHDHPEAGSGDPADEDSLSSVQHHALHAADQVQFLSDLPGNAVRVETEVSSIAQQYSSHALPRPALDQPFRPPRHIAPTA
jgi:hypothetical protein